MITAEYKEDENKNIIGANVVAIDITDKKLAEQEAEEKERIIFNKLETKIKEWRTELDQKVAYSKNNKLTTLDMNIEKISNDLKEI